MLNRLILVAFVLIGCGCETATKTEAAATKPAKTPDQMKAQERACAFLYVQVQHVSVSQLTVNEASGMESCTKAGYWHACQTTAVCGDIPSKLPRMEK